MSWLQALLIGLLQGLTEFLPISSSAHLTIAKMLFGLPISGEEQLLFDLFCHFGTLLALLFFLRHEIRRLLFEERRSLFLIFFATLPLIPFYVLLKPLRAWASHPSLLGFFLLATALILFVGERFASKKEKRSASFKDAFWIGSMQAVALMPGISRSASTISTARLLGWQMPQAVRFSFLLSIPTILGGNCLELMKATLSEEPVAFGWGLCALGFFGALIAGLLVVGPAIAFLERGKLKPCVAYCALLGLLTLYFVRG